MRLFNNLYEAGLEIERDLFKGFDVAPSRVQNRTNMELHAKERFGYSYSVSADGFPPSAAELVEIGVKLKFHIYVVKSPQVMIDWLQRELKARTTEDGLGLNYTADFDHPALQTTVEGRWPAYTYQERLEGSLHFLTKVLIQDPDTRRAYWPIFRPEDTIRAAAPTRIPCSLGYHFVIRNIGGSPKLLSIYYQRSADFLNFWLSDIWFAFQFGVALKESILDKAPSGSPLRSLEMGPIAHCISSFHLFLDTSEEIY